MKKVTFYLLIFFTILNCSTNEPVADNSETFVKGTINGEKWEGDGVTFFREDSTFHFMGLLGNSGFFIKYISY